MNLNGNAVKFTDEGGSITVDIDTRSADGAAWGEIRVTDTAPGIAAPEQAAILEPYYRSEGTAQLPGVGLGVAISHGLVQEMDGQLTLESEPGIGSSFIIRLPRLTTRDVRPGFVLQST